ncbi:MAG: hypothetical protein JW850_01775 [Thermoflexales bacterium]|nr:hypothetical protein [Thermoflexales bacterium]
MHDDQTKRSSVACLTCLFAALAGMCLTLAGLATFLATRPPPTPPTSIAQGDPTPTPQAGREPLPSVVLPSPLSSPLASPIAQGAPTPTPQAGREPLPSVVLPSPPSSPLASPTSPPTPTQLPTATPTPLDFNAIRAGLQAQGQELAFVKIGFHVGPGGNQAGLDRYLEALAAAGVPSFVKCVDDYTWCLQALNDDPNSTTVFRLTGGALELPDYKLPAEQSAEHHWARVLEALPPEFDRRTWIELMNEPYKEHADWLGRFALHIAQLALRDGYRWAAFGWSSGEPEPEHWETPAMLEFLALASQYPDQIAIALHEYSYSSDTVSHLYPYLIGRFQALFRICDQHGIPRSTVLITEWGWEARAMPPVDQAMDDIAWASRLYAAYPQVRGAAIWYLGGGYDQITDQVQQLIAPMREYALWTYFIIEPDQRPIDPSLFQP